jgi:hypothetical protein
MEAVRYTERFLRKHHFQIEKVENLMRDVAKTTHAGKLTILSSA